MAIIKTEAVILKCSNYREKSKIITFYSRSHGKMRGIAKGVRDVKSRWGGVLQSMASVNLMFYYNENRTLHLISGADFAKSYQYIYDDFEKMQVGYRIVELINKTTEDHHENNALFELLTNSLNSLNDATKNYVNVLFNFEFRLMKILGFEIDLSFFEAGSTEKVIDKFPKNNYNSNIVNEGNSEYGHNCLTHGDIKTLNLLNEGNYNLVMNLNIPKSSENMLDRFFDNYFKSHFDNLHFSNTKKVINSKEIYL